MYVVSKSNKCTLIQTTGLETIMNKIAYTSLKHSYTTNTKYLQHERFMFMY